MSSKQSGSTSSSSGIGFFGLLAIVFIALKLSGSIEWSWLWVLAPIWGGCLVAVVLLLVFIVITSIWGR